jgi:hypothetical protein
MIELKSPPGPGSTSALGDQALAKMASERIPPHPPPPPPNLSVPLPLWAGATPPGSQPSAQDHLNSDQFGKSAPEEAEGAGEAGAEAGAGGMGEAVEGLAALI